MNRLRVFFAALVFAASAPADDAMHGDMHIMQPWSRPLPAVSVNGAAYMTLMNMGSSPDRLMSVSTPAAANAELHNHIMEDGLMKMRPAGIIEIPAGGSTVLEPGGLHVMLLGLTEPLVEGKSFPLTLEFEHAGRVEVKVMVHEPEGAGGGHEHHDMKKKGS